MESGSQRIFRIPTALRAATLSLAMALVTAVTVHAGGFGGANSGAVGGVVIDSEGIVRSATVDEQQDFANRIRALLDAPAGDWNEASDMRVVSLRGLQDQVAKARAEGRPIPDEVSLMAGLTRIEYVFVDSDRSDILVAGPAEPWKLLPEGSIVGTKTGQTILRLDDLAVALQSVEMARQQGILCSIEPTAQGRANLKKMLSRVALRPGQNPSYLVPAMREAFGPQQVQLAGIPGESRMARTLVAADFEMKRLAMGLVDSPVRGLPSYLDMAKNSTQSRSSNPRWWMACDYDNLRRSDDGLAWKISGQGVKTMTDNDLIEADGRAVAANQKSKVAQRWADLMTQQFNELAKSMPVFSDLQSTMDMNVVATLIVQERLAEKANLDLTILSSDKDTLDLGSYFVPEEIPPHCSFIQGVNGWIVTASGGVDINAFQIVEKQTVDAKVADVRTATLAAAGDRWWWNK
ncbi:DUF1598 domain-containing protein [Crateriforma conspicua]|uniref:DUF1598 domain-containing protein n=2 Tax=Crateriforma conspicua TaxID=2527996 RepID=A0A5C5Y2J1_9PLAN|nr:DUF1598 domain-containing protein [Crateriforma conspicua]QDV63654.1 hypothetical protein Mal65_28000 [Crateriforma conspicua]TWT69039.1 hypothetical protein Pan14r_13230 [Crateriforma conspicua]